MPSPLCVRLAELALSLASTPASASPLSGAADATSPLAVVDERGSRSFADLYTNARRAALELTRVISPASSAGSATFPSDTSRSSPLAGKRVVLLASPGASWVEAFFGVILGGGIAVPLSPLYPPAELAWLADDAEADVAIVSGELAERAGNALISGGRRVLRPEDLTAPREAIGDDERGALADLDRATDALTADDPALLLYTSGTTGKPKGAVITHGNVMTQATLVGRAWGFHPGDTLLHALPLHHLHGLGISLMTALLSGATARMLPRFDAKRVWEEIALAPEGRCSVWMAVPTMYAKLIEAFDAADEAAQARYARGASALRLATSGSAALPVTLAERWRRLSGAVPLERFGMTEIGVGLSNPLELAGRRPGSVGLPLPTVETRLVDESGCDVERGPAELWIRGPSVFPRYWRRDEATKAAFSGDWFKTGDVAERSSDGYIKLLGRTSVDILKSGGYKLSALEIEEALREDATIAEVAVVGLPDATWGERVVAVVVPAPGSAEAITSELVRARAREILAPYKVPREVIFVRSLPRNALGKVVKPELVRSLMEGRLTG